MKPSFIAYIRSSVTESGEWLGKTQGKTPVVMVAGELQDATPYIAQLGLKLHHSDKYREQHADMEQPQSDGDLEDSGDGISES